MTPVEVLARLLDLEKCLDARLLALLEAERPPGASSPAAVVLTQRFP